MHLALVLSGGGTRAAFQVGVARALHEAGAVPTICAGTSAGALNAAALTAGVPIDDLEDLWRRLVVADVVEARERGWSTAPLRRTLVRVLGGERVPIAGDRTLVVSTVETRSRALVRFCNRAPVGGGDATFRPVEVSVDHVLASASLPYVFQPAVIDGVTYWDGGLVENVPTGAALAYRPDAMVIVSTTASAEVPRVAGVDVCAFAAPGSDGGATLGFDPSRASALIDAGFRAAIERLPRFLEGAAR